MYRSRCNIYQYIPTRRPWRLGPKKHLLRHRTNYSGSVFVPLIPRATGNIYFMQIYFIQGKETDCSQSTPVNADLYFIFVRNSVFFLIIYSIQTVHNDGQTRLTDTEPPCSIGKEQSYNRTGVRGKLLVRSENCCRPVTKRTQRSTTAKERKNTVLLISVFRVHC